MGESSLNSGPTSPIRRDAGFTINQPVSRVQRKTHSSGWSSALPYLSICPYLMDLSIPVTRPTDTYIHEFCFLVPFPCQVSCSLFSNPSVHESSFQSSQHLAQPDAKHFSTAQLLISQVLYFYYVVYYVPEIGDIKMNKVRWLSKKREGKTCQ